MIDMRGWVLTAGIGTLALLAACSNSGGGSRPAASGGGTTVSVRNISGGQVLVNSHGRTLYTSEQEKAAGKILCTSSDCKAIWTPLTIAEGQRPTGPTGVETDLGTVRRPDGSTQVTFHHEPLYTFSFDHGAGEVKGEGTKDSFDGIDFV